MDTEICNLLCQKYPNGLYRVFNQEKRNGIFSASLTR